MLITKAITNSAVHRLLRKVLISNIVKLVKKQTFESLINEVIASKLQMAVKAELKAIYPLKAVEITALKLLLGEEKAEAPIVEAVSVPEPAKEASADAA